MKAYLVRDNGTGLIFQDAEPPAYKYAIIKHRFEGRGGGLTFYPDTCPMGDAPTGTGKGHTIQIYPSWWQHIQKINSPEGYAYARSIGNMWINNEYDQTVEFPVPPATAESIECGGNFIAYDTETYTHVHLVSYNYLKPPTTIHPVIDNWKNKPWLYWKACAVNEGGQVINVANALDVYIPLIARTELWINKDYLELLPDGPNYRFVGVNVYDGDVPLLTIKNGVRQFHTDWRIETLGVVPPAGW